MAKSASLVAATLAALCLCSPAHALSNRAWVSGHGTDASGCGSPASPCRSLQYVHDNIVAAGGEIDVLDPAGYGAVTITKALSIANDGVGTAGVQAASGDAITINAGPNDVVTLRGLNIDGLGTAANGVVFNSGGGLEVVNCVIRHFNFTSSGTGSAILIQPSSGTINFLISDVMISDNGFAGVNYAPSSGAPSATGVIDHVTVFNSWFAIAIYSVASTGAVNVAISNSVASNSYQGIEIENQNAAAMTVSIDNSTMSGNTDLGLWAIQHATVLLGRSVITSNTVYGVLNGTSSNTLYTYGDNRIDGNGTNVSGGLNTTDKPQ